MRVYQGARLPAALRGFAAPAHTFERLAEDVLNGVPVVPAARQHSRPQLHPYQVPRVEAIDAAHAGGCPGYLLVAPTGSGKTAMAVGGLGHRPLDTVLVITKHGIIPAWLRSIDAFGAGQRWVVINPERLWKVFTHHQLVLANLAPERAAEIAAAEGVPHIPFDAVVVDESQILAHPESLRSRLVHRLAHPERGRPPFFLAASATPFSFLSETAYAAELIAYAAGAEPPDDLMGGAYLDWLASLRVTGDDGVARTVSDVETVKELLYRRGVGSSATVQDLGLPAQHRELHAIRLSEADRRRYDMAWGQFLAVHDPVAGPADDEEEDASSARGRALQLVMQASLLKAPHVARHVAALVASGHQVIVPAWYRRTVGALVWHIVRALRERGLPEQVVEITGTEPGLRERRRMAFQLGRARVCVTNVVEGINLHAGEADVDGRGTPATSAPRRTVIADVLTGGKRFLQAEGRGQRDGRQAPADYLVAWDTKEQEWLAQALSAAASTQDLAHAPADAEALLRLCAQLEDDGAGGDRTARVPAGTGLR
ncbi:helicase [Streptomyces sp. NPDC091280]|uniref:helicase n=1 Tax=Streptomyces sp. NPDC091280 TaxID=3365984 RepID=UPI00381FC7D9